MTPRDWPPVPTDLVDYLEHAFPPRCKDLNESLEEHARYAGTVDLVSILRARSALRDEDSLPDPEEMSLEEILKLQNAT